MGFGEASLDLLGWVGFLGCRRKIGGVLVWADTLSAFESDTFKSEDWDRVVICDDGTGICIGCIGTGPFDVGTMVTPVAVLNTGVAEFGMEEILVGMRNIIWLWGGSGMDGIGSFTALSPSLGPLLCVAEPYGL